MSGLAEYSINTALVPPGGWYYIQDMGDGSTQKIGPEKTDSALVDAVQRFRIQIGADAISAAQEIATQIIARNPRSDSKRIGRVAPKEPQIARIKGWQDSLSMSRIVTVPMHDITRRVSICAKCPQNIAWRTDVCKPCNDEIEKRSKDMRRQASYAPDVLLCSCRITGEHLQLSVFMDRNEHPAKNTDNLPDECWIKKEAK